MNKLIPITIIASFLVIMLSGCTSINNLSSNTGLSIFSKTPNYIGRLVAYTNGNDFEVYFSLMDADNEYMKYSGEATIVIKNQEEDILYTNSFTLTEDDFGQYTQTLTGEKFIAAQINIPTKDIKKSFGFLATGKILVTFRNEKDNIYFDALESTALTLPTYSEEEMSKINSENFEKSAEDINIKLTTENGIEITLLRGASFEQISYTGKQNIYGVEVSLKNTKSTKQTFSSTSNQLYDVNGNQYSATYAYDLYNIELQPDTVKKIQINFPLNDKITLRAISLTDEYIFDIEKNNAYTLTSFIENKYLENSVEVNHGVVTTSGMRINILNVGNYDVKSYYSITTNFRVDIKVENSGDSTNYFWGSSDIGVTDNSGNQYDAQYGGTLSSSSMLPGTIKIGYLLFKEIPEEVSDINIIIKTNSYPESYETIKVNLGN